MLRLLGITPRRRARDRRFRPTDPRQERGGSLEGRSLAVPAFWMQGPGSLIPNLAQANSAGNAMSNGVLLAGLDQTQSGLAGATVTPTLDADIASVTFTDPMMGMTWTVPGAHLTMAGLASSTIVDFPNPGNGSGAGNIGNYTVSANAMATVNWTGQSTAGSPNIFGTLGANANWSRAYTLADDQFGTPGSQVTYTQAPVFLHETFDVACSPAGPNAGAIVLGAAGLNTGPGLQNGVPDGGLSVAVASLTGALGQPNVVFGGAAVPLTVNPITGNSGTGSLVLGNGSAVSVTWSPLSLHVSTSIPIAGLPTTTFGGVVVGPNWFVTGNAGVGVTTTAAAATSPGGGQTSMTSNYHGWFSNYPTTA
ncbi:hypothetical protein V5E97_26310 [Singulisphaera sp. Ch08]|uniref:Uncharacterized protein n=1 Tax=Singulisphaera sp. Ch08 TaxID=3120278 RepID=A0AAU7C9L7_9BACT